MRQSWLLVILLGCVGVASAQFPPCIRSKFANEWPIRVGHVDLQDGDKLSHREKSTVVRELRRQCDCWPCALSSDVSDQIREIYQWYGYFQAVADVDVRKTGIDSYSITARVQEGPQYRLGDITFSNVFKLSTNANSIQIEQSSKFSIKFYRYKRKCYSIVVFYDNSWIHTC
jgi:hypothetical protein